MCEIQLDAMGSSWLPTDILGLLVANHLADPIAERKGNKSGNQVQQEYLRMVAKGSASSPMAGSLDTAVE